MDKLDKYLGEARKIKKQTDRKVVQDWSWENTEKATALQKSYYGVMDHIENLAVWLNDLTGDTGLFGNDLKNAVKARDALRKLTIGKYV